MVLPQILSHIIIISEAFKETVKKFGDIDIVVNNAGLCNEKKWKYVVSVNLVSSKKSCTYWRPRITCHVMYYFYKVYK
jgi:NAD(P)-dependent dehydrogenase (short-subunit alcohol dehydrogenase family)